MQTLYIEATKTIIRKESQIYVHPETGIIYGGTDYSNQSKLNEIGAKPLTFKKPQDGYMATGWEIVEEGEGYVKQPSGVIVRPEPQEEALQPAKDLLEQSDAALIAIAARTIEDLIQDRIDSGKFVSQDVKDKIDERKALRIRMAEEDAAAAAEAGEPEEL